MQAFALATHLAKAHSASLQAGGEGPTAEPQLPRLLSRMPAALPGIASVPPLLLGGKDVSCSLATAVPGYDQVRSQLIDLCVAAEMCGRGCTTWDCVAGTLVACQLPLPPNRTLS